MSFKQFLIPKRKDSVFSYSPNITQKEIVLAKLKQYYGSKIVHLLQNNEITESSPKALKNAKT